MTDMRKLELRRNSRKGEMAYGKNNHKIVTGILKFGEKQGR